MRHEKSLHTLMDLKGIAVVIVYCCQLVVINNSGSTALQINPIKRRSNYL
jgi:hypothetical protein